MNTAETWIQIEQLHSKLSNSTDSYPCPIRVNQWLNFVFKEIKSHF